MVSSVWGHKIAVLRTKKSRRFRRLLKLITGRRQTEWTGATRCPNEDDPSHKGESLILRKRAIFFRDYLPCRPLAEFWIDSPGDGVRANWANGCSIFLATLGLRIALLRISFVAESVTPAPLLLREIRERLVERQLGACGEICRRILLTALCLAFARRLFNRRTFRSQQRAARCDCSDNDNDAHHADKKPCAQSHADRQLGEGGLVLTVAGYDLKKLFAASFDARFFVMAT
jgi:hypothetical protein